MQPLPKPARPPWATPSNCPAWVAGGTPCPWCPWCPWCLWCPWRGREARSRGAQRGPGESPRVTRPAMREEWSSQPPLLKRRAAEEEEAGRKESLVCVFPEPHRNCYMRNYLTSLTSPDALHRLPPLSPHLSFPPSSCDSALRRAAASPLGYPSTGSWFPPGCESSSASLRFKFIHTCPSSWMDACSLPACGSGSLALPGRASRGGWGGSWVSSCGEDAAGEGWLVGCSVGPSLGAGVSGRWKSRLCIYH